MANADDWTSSFFFLVTMNIRYIERTFGTYQ